LGDINGRVKLLALNKMLKLMKKAWNYKTFRIGVIINAIYLIISIVLTLTSLRNFNDFQVYYKVGEVFINNINDLYNKSNYYWPFRYFPLSALFFVPFYFLGFDLGFIAFNFVNFILNFLIIYLIYKIVSLKLRHNLPEKLNFLVLYITFFLFGLPQIFNYMLGQVNLYVTFFVLSALYLFLKRAEIKWQFLASVILGLSVLIKPITLFLFPFLIIIWYSRFEHKFYFKFKLSVIRLIGAIIPLFLNLIVFIMNPILLEGFIKVNLTGEETILINHSMSLTKIISNLLYLIGFNKEALLNYQSLIFLIVSGIFITIGFIAYLFRKKEKNSLINIFSIGILIMFISYFDTWDHHLLILLPLLIIQLVIFKDNNEVNLKPLKYSFLGLNFVSLGFTGIVYALGESFPFNFLGTTLLVICFYFNYKIFFMKES